MAPPMKELPRWLLENPEFSVAPDWTDIVKQSVSNQDINHADLLKTPAIFSNVKPPPYRVFFQKPCLTAF